MKQRDKWRRDRKRMNIKFIGTHRFAIRALALWWSRSSCLTWAFTAASSSSSSSCLAPPQMMVSGPSSSTTALFGTATEVPSNSVVVSASRSIPKAETGILDLWKAYPKADGRGVKIAILDTGCDLRADGLQETTEGLPKYLDFIDCTGGGDVDVSHVLELKHNNSSSTNATTTMAGTTTTIKGLSGRELTLGPWAENLTQVRLGAVRLYRLLPQSVQSRLQNERKELFTRQHQRLMAHTQQTLDGLQWKIDQISASQKDTEEYKTLIKNHTDTQLLLDQYQAMMDSYQDPGPYMDVVLFEQPDAATSDRTEVGSSQYRAVIDLQANGNLSQAIPMAPFAQARQVGELGFGAAVTFCVQMYDDGRILSIVTDAGSHGTHVAGIAAAHFPSNNSSAVAKGAAIANNATYRQELLDRNGVAPGAQILACKIGDGRLGSAETGTGLVRALIAAKRYGCDLINLSYGEPSWQPDSGRVAQTFADAVHKWGMAVFTSAGNDGPALSSLGSPGTLSAPITVGAFISPDMMVDQYSTLPSTDSDAPLRDASYHFSSRGPTPDGCLPDLCAPGGAIAPIPRHALQRKAQYHGTSMSSPNACGVAACVLSALRMQGLESCSPIELRRGLVNSAKPVGIPDHFAQGRGLISATSAVDYILQHHGKPGQDLSFDVSLPERNNARGIYVRDSLEIQGPMTFNVNVKPRFDHSIERTHDEMEELLSLEIDLKLTPSESWITCPERMTLFSAQERGGQSFSVRLSGVQELSAGAHFATVDAVDASAPSRGPLFQVPVTVIVPHSQGLDQENSQLVLNSEESFTLQDNGIDFTTTFKLLPGAPNRRFINVPPHAEWATIIVKSLSPDASEESPQRIIMHAIPFARGDLPNRHIQLKKLMALTERVEKKFHMKVKGGSTLELCLQLLWLANPAPASTVVDIEFHSLSTRAPTLMSSQPLFIPPAQEFARFGVSANLRSETLKPNAKLTAVHRTVSPTSYNINAGSKDQDIVPPSDAEKKQADDQSQVPGNQIYDMTLKYDFKIEGSEDVKVTPSIPSLFNQLYDSPLDSQLWELRDSNSQILGYGGAMHHSPAITLSKGEYSINYFTRHPSRQVLEQMKDIPLRLAFTLTDKSALECMVYSQIDRASTPSVTSDGRKPVGSMVLRKGSHQDLYIARPTGSLPSWCTPGDVLVGTVVLDDNAKEASSMALSYTVPPKANVKKLNENKLPEDQQNNKSLDDVIFESKVAYLSRLRKKDSPAYQELASSLKQENSTHLPLLLELLSFAKEGNITDDSKKGRMEAIKTAFDNFLVANGGPIDESTLAQYFGVTAPTEDELQQDQEAKALKQKMEEHKKGLQKGMLSLADALAELALSDPSHVEDFDSMVKRLNKWISSPSDLSDTNEKLSFALVKARHTRLCRGKIGNAVSILTLARKDLGTDATAYKKITQELLSIFRSQSMTEHLSDSLMNDLHKRFPPKGSK